MRQRVASLRKASDLKSIIFHLERILNDVRGLNDAQRILAGSRKDNPNLNAADGDDEYDAAVQKIVEIDAAIVVEIDARMAYLVQGGRGLGHEWVEMSIGKSRVRQKTKEVEKKAEKKRRMEEKQREREEKKKNKEREKERIANMGFGERCREEMRGLSKMIGCSKDQE